MPAEETTNYITRGEFETHLSTINAQVAQVEARIYAEQVTLKANIDTKFDKVIDRLDKLKEDVFKTQTSGLRFTISILMSFLVGGSGVALLEYFLMRK